MTTMATTGCVVGPKYHVPTAPAPTAPAYKETATPALARASGSADADANMWKPAQPSDAMLRGKWWEVFGDQELNGLEEQLDINNQTIKQYFQNFLEARTLIREARSQFYPTLSVGPSFNRSRQSSNLVNSIGTTGTGTTGTGTTGTGTGTGTGATVGTDTGRQATVWDAPLDISWEPDLWGRIRNTVRSDQYAAQLSAADLENEKLTEEATLAETFFELRGEDRLQKVLNNVVDADRRSYDLTKSQYELGIADQISVLQAETTLRSAESAAINVGVARSQYEHAIATLIGKPASDFTMPFRPVTTAPPPLPVGVPSQLLERRPDIAAAERTMASANAQIGVAVAAYYPTLDLTADGGFESSTFKHWFDWPSRIWSIGPTFSETVYDAGLRRATVQQYTATYNADVASYRQTVLTAFQQVEDYLAEVRILSVQIQKQQQATEAAQKYADLENDRYRTGLDPYLDVTIAETTLLGDQQSLVSLQIEQMTSAVQLVQALGGGWDHSDLPTPKQVGANLTRGESSKTP
jgi:NodT family efflux transporter outer membrane factor (OMF) lipoprotein